MEKKRIILILMFLSLLNLGLSISVETQKSNTEHDHTGFWGENCKACALEEGINSCFSESSEHSGCFDVQTSNYANTFGVSNPIYGIFSFSLIFLLLFGLLVGIKNKKIVFLRKNFANIKIALFFLIIGGCLISLWFLYLQFFIIKSLCSYCIFVDIIMIFITLLYLVLIFKL